MRSSGSSSRSRSSSGHARGPAAVASARRSTSSAGCGRRGARAARGAAVRPPATGGSRGGRGVVPEAADERPDAPRRSGASSSSVRAPEAGASTTSRTRRSRERRRWTGRRRPSRRAPARQLDQVDGTPPRRSHAWRWAAASASGEILDGEEECGGYRYGQRQPGQRATGRAWPRPGPGRHRTCWRPAPPSAAPAGTRSATRSSCARLATA